jgi:hypothetical protein
MGFGEMYSRGGEAHVVSGIGYGVWSLREKWGLAAYMVFGMDTQFFYVRSFGNGFGSHLCAKRLG